MSSEYKNSKPTTSNTNRPTTSRKVVRLPSTSASKADTITFSLCPKPGDMSSAMSVEYNKEDTLEKLKEFLSRKQDKVGSIDDFDLVYFDKTFDRWKSIDQSDLSITLEKLKIPTSSFISIKIKTERQAKTDASKKTLQDIEYNIKLCIKPKKFRPTTDLKAYSSNTFDQLRKQIYAKFHVSSKEKPLYVWNDSWILFDADFNDRQLSDFPWLDNAYVSIDLGIDYDRICGPPGLVGLYNLGNTCFVNSVIQCFSHTPEFTRRILNLPKDIDSPFLSQYIHLLKKMWSGTQRTIDMYDFILNIRQSMTYYKRGRQQDAQEFMNHFLYAMHDELTEKETLISELFFGKIQSKVKCVKCQNTENNHDTISFLPLPLGDADKLKTFMLIKCDGELSFHTIFLESSVIRLKEVIRSLCETNSLKQKPEQIEALELVNNVIAQKYSEKTYLDQTNQQHLVFREIPEKSSKEKLIECIFRVRSMKKHFRPPVSIVCSSKLCLLDDIQHQIDDLFGHISSIANASPKDLHFFWTSKYDGEIYCQNTYKEYNTPLKHIESIGIELDIEFARIYQQNYDILGISDSDSLVGLLKEFFSEIPLNGGYRCSKCRMMTAANQITRLCLPLPPVLIIQLKRFTYEAEIHEKIDKLISFPLKELDLSDYIVENTNNCSWSSKYDLVAVSNHSGSLHSGHYTTYAKYLTDDQWYLFDDSSIESVPCHDDVITKNAYLLIYVLRENQ